MHICTNLHYESDCILSACVCAYDRIAAHTHTDVNRGTPFDHRSFIHSLFSFSLFNMTATYRLQLPLLIITYVIFSSLPRLVHAIEYGKHSHQSFLFSYQSIISRLFLLLLSQISCTENQSENSHWTWRYQCTSRRNSSIFLYCIETIRCYRHLVLEWFLYLG